MPSRFNATASSSPIGPAPTMTTRVESCSITALSADGHLGQRVLLFLVSVMRAGGRRGGDRTSDIPQLLIRAGESFQAFAEERPRAHVARLVLYPQHLRRAAVRFE